MRDASPRKRRRSGLRIAVWVALIAGGAFAVFWGVCVRMPGSSHRGALPPADAALRGLAAKLRDDVTRQADVFGERHHLRPDALRATAEWLQSELVLAGHTPQAVAFDVDGERYANIQAELPGTGPELIIVGAHYDTAYGAQGANDNGSGVAATLALARMVPRQPRSKALRFVFFANEEPPFFQTAGMGSVRAAQQSRSRGERITAMFSLETLGYFDDEEGSQHYPFPLSWFYPERGNFAAFVGNVGSCSLVRRSLGAFRTVEALPSEGGCLPEALPGVGWSDHWSYWQNGYPALMVTDTALFRYPHYHTQRDGPVGLDYLRMARLVRGLGMVLDELRR